MDVNVLAVRGVGGYRQYRIPALAMTPSGRLIAVYDGRPDLDDLPLPIDLVIRTSDDNGITWSEQQVLRKSHDIAGFGDASIIVDPNIGPHGRILVFSQGTQLAGFFESTVGNDPNDPMIVQICVSQSDDDGNTWSHRLITDQLKDDSTPGIFASSGMGGYLASGPYAGRLLHTFNVRRGNQLMGAIGYSDDHGDTWTLGATIPGGNESAIVGLPDGSILVHSRATPFRVSGRSFDGGVTLDHVRPDEALPDPSDNGSLCLLTSGAVICTHNHDSDLRRRTVVKKSYDGGKTWPETAVVAPGSSAYSTACELRDGSIGVLFERNGYAEMVFARVFEHDFAPTPAALPLEVDADGIEFTIALRFVRPARREVSEEFHSDPKRRFVPEVDMSTWRPFERKEIGQAGGSASGEPLYTWDELDVLLGPISPGLHLGDEVRLSGRLANLGNKTLSQVTIENSCDAQIIKRDVVAPTERIVFLDVRHVVTESDLARGKVSARFTWSATLNGEQVGGEVVQEFSTTTGLPLAEYR